LERTQLELVAPVSEVIEVADVRRGDRVEAGQLLVRLDGTLAAAEVATAEAALAGARTSDRVSEHELARARRLRGERVTSEQTLDRAQLGRDEAAARLREAEARLDVARKHARDLEILSPVAGVLDQLPFESGERVPVGAVVAVVLSDGPAWVRVWVPEDRAVRVHPGLPAEIRIDGIPEPLAGAVLDVSREPEFTPHYALTERDRVHLVYETRVEIRGRSQLRPGVPAEVRLNLEDPDVDAPEAGQ